MEEEEEDVSPRYRALAVAALAGACFAAGRPEEGAFLSRALDVPWYVLLAPCIASLRESWGCAERNLVRWVCHAEGGAIECFDPG